MVLITLAKGEWLVFFVCLSFHIVLVYMVAQSIILDRSTKQDICNMACS